MDEAVNARGSTKEGLALSLDVPARPGAVAQARNQVSAFAEAHGASDSMLEDVELAVSEAVTNAVVHGYGADGRGSVVVRACVAAGALVVTVVDRGRGLRAGTSSGLGKGLSLIATVCSDFSISQPRTGGVEVRMQFALT